LELSGTGGEVVFSVEADIWEEQIEGRAKEYIYIYICVCVCVYTYIEIGYFLSDIVSSDRLTIPTKRKG